MSRTRNALLTSFAASYIEMVVQFAATIVLARLLTPTEIGTFSVAAVFVAIAHILRNFGVGQYLIQEKELTPDRIRAALFVAISVAWTIALVLMLASEPLSRFYEAPGLREIIIVLACNFFILPFGTIVRAYWRRNLHFRPIFIVRIISTVARALSSVILAMLGFGYMSLAWSVLIGTAVNVILSTIMRPKELPWLAGTRELKKVFRFSGWVTGAGAARETGNAAPDMIIGKALGMEAVGFMGKALGTVQIFNRLVLSAIRPVVLPHFSAINRAGGNTNAAYQRAISYITVLAWPFFGFIGLFAKPVIMLLYGAQWEASVPLLQILCIYGMISAPFSINSQILLANGRARRDFRIVALIAAAKILLIIASVPFGLAAVSAALVITAVINVLLYNFALSQLIGISFSHLLSTIYKSLIISALSLLAPTLLISSDFMRDHSLWLFAASGFLLLLTWGGGIFLFRHPLSEEVALLLSKRRTRGALDTDNEQK